MGISNAQRAGSAWHVCMAHSGESIAAYHRNMAAPASMAAVRTLWRAAAAGGISSGDENDNRIGVASGGEKRNNENQYQKTAAWQHEKHRK